MFISQPPFGGLMSNDRVYQYKFPTIISNSFITKIVFYSNILICLQSGSVHLFLSYLKSLVFSSQCYYQIWHLMLFIQEIKNSNKNNILMMFKKVLFDDFESLSLQKLFLISCRLFQIGYSSYLIQHQIP